MKEDQEKSIKKLEKEAKKRKKKELESAELKIKQAKAEEAELKLLQTKQKIAQADSNAEGKLGSISEPRKSLSTYLRNQNKFEVNSLSVLDRKAAILIKICPTIISGLIVFHEYIENNVAGGYAIIIILLTGLFLSLILSIISIRPATRGFKKIVENKIKPLYPNQVEHSFFTWEFNSFEDYDKATIEIIKSQDLQLGNMMRANYILGTSNTAIAKYIDLAYSAFLSSFVLAGFAFILYKYFIG